MYIAITGASGFVGQALCPELLARDHVVRAAVRSQGVVVSGSVSTFESIVVGQIDAKTDWSDLLAGVDCVIHCAARAHVMYETETDALAAYRVVNVEGTRRLAEQSAASGVRRLVYLSSIKVNGEGTIGSRRFTHDDEPMPEDPYGISKWEAEQALHEVAARTGLEVVIIRPPLVYGPGVKGNFLSMLGWLKRGVPLPLGSIHNKRSLVGIDNLVDLIITCIDHPAAANQTLLVSDEEDLSTTELLQRMSLALGKPVRLISVPAQLLQFGAQMFGKKDVAQRLLGNLQIDISKTKEILGWTPPISVEEGLRKTAEWYLNQR